MALPALAAGLLGGLVQIAGTLAGRVLLSLGFSVVTYGGVSVVLGWLKSQAVGSLSGLSLEMVQLIAYLKVGEAISIVFSALVVRLTLNGLSSGGSISKLVKGG
jgi:hypothetical protein